MLQRGIHSWRNSAVRTAQILPQNLLYIQPYCPMLTSALCTLSQAKPHRFSAVFSAKRPSRTAFGSRAFSTNTDVAIDCPYQQPVDLDKDYEELEWVPKERHTIWRVKELSTGKLFRAKEASLRTVALDAGLYTSSGPKEDEKNLLFAAQNEVFFDNLIQLFAPENSRAESKLGIRRDGNKTRYFVLGSEIPEKHFLDFSQLPPSASFAGPQGETRVMLDKERNHSIAYTGRIRTKYALFCAGESDCNPQNLVIVYDKSKPEPYTMLSIDHELCGKYSHELRDHAKMAKSIVRDHISSILPNLNLSHLQLSRREAVRADTMDYLAQLFKERTKIRSLFPKYFSSDHSPANHAKIVGIARGLGDIDRIITMGNALVKGRWDETDKMADAIWRDAGLLTPVTAKGRG